MQRQYRGKCICVVYAVIAILNGVATATVFDWVWHPVADDLSSELLSAIFTLVAYMLLTGRRVRHTAPLPHHAHPCDDRPIIGTVETSGYLGSAGH